MTLNIVEQPESKNLNSEPFWDGCLMFQALAHVGVLDQRYSTNNDSNIHPQTPEAAKSETAKSDTFLIPGIISKSILEKYTYIQEVIVPCKDVRCNSASNSD